MPISAGRLRERTILQAPDLVENGRGARKAREGTDGWREIGRPRAEILPLRGDEALRLGVERRVQIWRVTIRRRDEVTAGCRLLWQGKVLEIKSAAPSGDGTVMTAESGAHG